MRGGTGWGRAVLAFAVAAVLLTGTACADSGAPPGPPVPTFPASAAGSSPGSVTNGAGPDACARLLTVSDLGALLGMPLDTVAVRTTIGTPAPAVGRTERVSCAYTAIPARGRALLDLTAAAYGDAAAAQKQWRVNADAEDGDRRELPIGSASAVLVERSGEALLTVVYGSGTLTFQLPDRPLPGDRPRGDVLVDIALRVLPAIAGAAPAAPAADPAQAAGTVS